MGKPRILILGASRYYLPTIKAAQSMGCWVAVIDRNPRAAGLKTADMGVAVDIIDVPGAVEVGRKYKIDGVLAVNDFGVMTAALVAKTLGLPGLPLKAARIATSKALMRDAWSGESFNPEYGVVTSEIEAVKTAKHIGLPVVFKPADSRGGGSRGVSVVHHEGEIKNALDFAQSFYDDKRVVVERFIKGLEHSAECIVYNGQCHIVAVSDKKKTPLPFRVDKDVIYPANAALSEMREIEKTAARAIELAGITQGIVHAELCSTKNGVYMYEIGARCGGGHTPHPICPWVSGVEELNEALRLSLGQAPENLSPSLARGCVYRFLTPPPGRLVSVTGLDDLSDWEGILDAGVLVEPGQMIHSIRVGGERSGFIIAGARDRAEALALAGRAENHIRFQIDNGA